MINYKHFIDDEEKWYDNDEEWDFQDYEKEELEADADIGIV